MMLTIQARRLSKKRRKVARGVENSDNLQGLPPRVIHDQIIRVRLRNPKAKRQGSQVFPHASCKGGTSQKIAGPKYRIFDAACSLWIVLSYKVPNVGKVTNRLRCELISAHSRRYSTDRVRFRWLSLERTSSGSINSPRCAAA